MAWDDAPPIDALTLAALGDLFDGDPRPEFLLLGTGAGLRQPPRPFHQQQPRSTRSSRGPPFATAR